METLPYRIIRNEPGKFEKLLSKEGIVILNKGGKPFAIILDATAESLEGTLRLVSQVKAQMSVSAMRISARERGLDRLTPEEIQAEIDAVRKTRSRK
jgi:putative PIN family toxin of toxin-antitoxin system